MCRDRPATAILATPHKDPIQTAFRYRECPGISRLNVALRRMRPAAAGRRNAGSGGEAQSRLSCGSSALLASALDRGRETARARVGPGVDRRGPAEEKSLDTRAAGLPQEVPLLRRLDAFRDDHDIASATEIAQIATAAKAASDRPSFRTKVLSIFKALNGNLSR